MQKRKSVFAIVLSFMLAFSLMTQAFAHNHEQDDIDTSFLSEIIVDPEEISFSFDGELTTEPMLEIQMADAVPIEDEIEITGWDMEFDTTIEVEWLEIEAITDDEINDMNVATEDSIALRAINLMLENLTYNPNYSYPFTGYGTANFLYNIANYGNEDAHGIVVGVYVDNTFVGNVSLGTIEAYTRYTCQLQLSGIAGGTHTVKLTCNNTNSTVQGSFVWNGTPDLTASVSSSVSKEYALYDIPFTFTIYNRGNADITRSFTVEIGANGKKLGTATIPSLAAGYQTGGEFNLNSTAYGTIEVYVYADSTNVIVESNENNNRAATTVEVIYCVHLGSSNITQVYANSPIVIQVESSASSIYTDTSLFTTAPQVWNGISSNVRISNNVTYSDNRSLGSDVYIVSEPLAYGHAYGQTIDDRDDFNRPVKVVILTPNRNSPNISRTLSHEFGHVLGLGDVNNASSNRCVEDYPSIMVQTGGHMMANYVTLHDEYNLIDEWGR